MISFYRVGVLILKIIFGLSTLIAKTNFPGLDIFSSSLSLGMGGAGYLMPPSPSYSNINPSIYKGKIFSSSIIRYPASIISQNAGIILPLSKGFGSFSLNYLSYGTFDGYDEDAQSTGTFNASDTKLTAGYSFGLKNYPLNFGISSNFFISNYSKHKFYIGILNMGLHYNFQKYGILLGMSIHNVGKNFSNLGIDLEPKLVISSSKKLKYLPLTIYADCIAKRNVTSIILLGGEFQIRKEFQFRIGTSTNKFNQNIQKNISNTLLGATGMGLSYRTQTIFFHYGIFFYGTGGIVHGFEVEIKI